MQTNGLASILRFGPAAQEQMQLAGLSLTLGLLVSNLVLAKYSHSSAHYESSLTGPDYVNTPVDLLILKH